MFAGLFAEIALVVSRMPVGYVNASVAIAILGFTLLPAGSDRMVSSLGGAIHQINPRFGPLWNRRRDPGDDLLGLRYFFQSG